MSLSWIEPSFKLHGAPNSELIFDTTGSKSLESQSSSSAKNDSNMLHVRHKATMRAIPDML